jgi:hypothetical protein
MQFVVQTGKIHAGPPGPESIRKAFEAQLGMRGDVSLIRQGVPFGNPPFIKVL